MFHLGRIGAFTAFIIVLALGAASEARAERYAFLCQDPSGVTVPLPGGPTLDMSPDGISGGYYHITISDTQPVAISFRDAMGRRVNLADRGAQIYLTAAQDSILRIDVLDPAFPLESFTFMLHLVDARSAFLTYVQVSPISSITPRVSVFQAACDIVSD